jgi:hypothetical protein
MKAVLKRTLLGVTRTHLRTDSRPLSRLLENGLATVFDGADAEAHRVVLEDTLHDLGAAGSAAAIGLERLRPLLHATPYKYPLHGERWHAAAGGWSFRLGSRLAASHNIAFDILTLRQDGQIPPHAHEGTVSGMLVVEGEVGIKTFDLGAPLPDGAVLESRLDGRFGPGGVSTSSDRHHNVHWIKGIAPISLVFRYSLTGLRAAPVASGAAEPRHYILPTRVAGQPIMQGRWVGEAEAKAADYFASLAH